ncbi:N utilization substance protein B [Allopseudospirillum japonicum]|uniref:Transcription antitermination protein NusB n=1 Tax=Allopseudospirillum japonicum TaxID=64971 RepID=A0A1H6UJ30_9GAMM|nr:transcription antitermination factor NusB [Allopseudospirillum japonicum]SEI88175.1 N utilization substance protein B [Allopseudospirillum japonicum]
MSQKKTNRAQQRHNARQLIVQALYQWKLTSASLGQIELQIRGAVPDDSLEAHEDIAQTVRHADLAYFSEVLHIIPKECASLDALILPYLDRSLNDLDPIELAILRLGTYEMSRRLDVPYRVIINEGVELAKSFGGTDSHKYINGVLDRLAQQVRSQEVQAPRPARRQSAKK